MNNTISTAVLRLTGRDRALSKPEAKVELNFRRITPADMPLIMSYMDMEEGRTTDFSYGGILMWVDLFDYDFAIAEETLFIKGRLENNIDLPAYSMPIGRLSLSQSLKLLRRHADDNHLPLQFSAVPEYALSEFMNLNPHHITLLDGWGDYIYDIEKLATLSGKKMAKKRNHVNQYEAICGTDTFEPITAENIAEVVDYMARSDKEIDQSTLSKMAKAERELTRKTLELMASGADTQYSGGLLRHDGKVIAFTVGDVKHDTLYIHIEKADRDVAGSYEAINKYFADYMWKKHPELQFVNREDDAGDPGLRKAKESYRPVEVLRKYNVIF